MSGIAPKPVSPALNAARRLVVKVGSALLVDAEGGVRQDWLEGLCADLAELAADTGVEIIVVTSGAIAIGRRRLKLTGTLRLDESQAASAAGQAQLIEAWQRAFALTGRIVAQVLLTLEDTEQRRRYLNARATILTLLGLGAVPVVNENDTIATTEIRYGDNDRLAAHTAQLAGADILLILSDIDGLYTADPRADPAARHIDVVDCVTPAIEAMAGGANLAAGVGTGGMATKVAAARIAGASGCATIIAPGSEDRPVSRLRAGGRATLFRPQTNPESARKRWIGGRLRPSGAIVVDAGAATALAGGASLLPAGIVRVEGDFARGDAVSVVDPAGSLLGQGLSAFDSSDLRRIVGRQTRDIDAILGYRRRALAIDRHDFVLAASLQRSDPYAENDA